MSAVLRGSPAAPGVALGAPWIVRPSPPGSTIRHSMSEAASMASDEYSLVRKVGDVRQ